MPAVSAIRRRGLLGAATVMLGVPLVTLGAGRRQAIRVGPAHDLKRPSEAARVARDGDIVEIDAGDYFGDVAVWQQTDLAIRASGGRVRLFAAGQSAENKATWVVRGGDVAIEGFDFFGARSSNRNGAGIRVDSHRVRLLDCGFFDNENGILTANDRALELEVEGCEFGHNGHGDGYSHNLYAGFNRRLRVFASYFHHARVGHLLKSRADESFIVCNRLTDEAGGQASYELEFPSGGMASVLGNLIEQSGSTRNPAVVSYGAEGYRNRRNELVMAHNTLVNRKPVDGVFVVAWPGERHAVVAGNLLVGGGALRVPEPAEIGHNPEADAADFVAPDRYDFRPVAGASWAKQGIPGDPVPQALDSEYVHPRGSRKVSPRERPPGAFLGA